MKTRWISFLVAASSFLLPTFAWAQSSITGVVRDTSGAVLPGVTVEASSPALIERVRSTVTDDQGRYRIVDLRPGTYTVTFALTGFTTSKREGLDLRAEFTATVNADLAVGTLEETVTVSGDAPIVDLRSSRAQVQFAQETLQSLPGTGRLAAARHHPGRHAAARKRPWCRGPERSHADGLQSSWRSGGAACRRRGESPGCQSDVRRLCLHPDQHPGSRR